MLNNSIPVGMREYYGESFASCTVSTTWYDPKQSSDTSRCENIQKDWMDLDGTSQPTYLAIFWWLSTQLSREIRQFRKHSLTKLPYFSEVCGFGRWDFLKEDTPCTHLFSGQPDMEVLWYSLCRAEISSGPKIRAWMALSIGMVNFHSALKGGDIGDIESKSPQQTCSEKRGCGAPGGTRFFRILQRPL